MARSSADKKQKEKKKVNLAITCTTTAFTHS